jgi:hypothetical protein
MSGQNLLTIKQAAAAYGLPEFGLRGLVKRRAFPVIQCGTRCYVTRAVLEAYLEKGGELYAAGNIKRS